MRLSALTVRRGPRTVLHPTDLTVAAGEFVGLLGPNGAGKTTLLRAALGLLPAAGQSSLARLAPDMQARQVAFLPQTREVAWPMPVEALVALGRPTSEAADRALAAMALSALRHRPATELSGGEQARALIARALAQETPLLLADEPVAGLDPAAQIRVMRAFHARTAAGGSVVASLHDLGLAARHCTRIVLMAEGRIVDDGAPADVLTQENLALVFGIRAHLAQGPDGLVVQPASLSED